MYVLNNNEKGMLRVIIRNARADYFRNNKYFLYWIYMYNCISHII